MNLSSIAKLKLLLLDFGEKIKRFVITLKENIRFKKEGQRELSPEPEKKTDAPLPAEKQPIPSKKPSVKAEKKVKSSKTIPHSKRQEASEQLETDIPSHAPEETDTQSSEASLSSKKRGRPKKSELSAPTKASIAKAGNNSRKNMKNNKKTKKSSTSSKAK